VDAAHLEVLGCQFAVLSRNQMSLRLKRESEGTRRKSCGIPAIAER
jgi:hypothetical protein